MPNPSPLYNPPAPGPGRPKGKLNPRTIMQQKFADRCIDAAEEERLIVDFHNRTLHPSLILLFAHYKWGKPHEHIELSTPDGPLQLSRVEVVVVDRALQGAAHNVGLLSEPTPVEAELVSVLEDSPEPDAPHSKD